MATRREIESLIELVHDWLRQHEWVDLEAADYHRTPRDDPEHYFGEKRTLEAIAEFEGIAENVAAEAEYLEQRSTRGYDADRPLRKIAQYASEGDDGAIALRGHWTLLRAGLERLIDPDTEPAEELPQPTPETQQIIDLLNEGLAVDEIDQRTGKGASAIRTIKSRYKHLLTRKTSHA